MGWKKSFNAFDENLREERLETMKDERKTEI